MKEYIHAVKYYETDRMGITHHSNYVRWMEEARIDLLEQIGWSYQKFEEEGLISPVTSIECKYRHPTTFPDLVHIEVFVEDLREIRLKLGYRMTNDSGRVVCEAASEHCFLGKNGKVVRIDKEYPEFYQLLSDLARKQKTE